MQKVCYFFFFYLWTNKTVYPSNYNNRVLLKIPPPLPSGAIHQKCGSYSLEGMWILTVKAEIQAKPIFTYLHLKNKWPPWNQFHVPTSFLYTFSSLASHGAVSAKMKLTVKLEVLRSLWVINSASSTFTKPLVFFSMNAWWYVIRGGEIVKCFALIEKNVKGFVNSEDAEWVTCSDSCASKGTIF